MIDGEATCKDCPKLKELESMNANINNRCIKMEGAMRLLQEENARLKATISKMENVDEHPRTTTTEESETEKENG